MEIKRRTGLKFKRTKQEFETNKEIHAALERFKYPKPHSMGEQFMAERMARKAAKAFQQGSKIKGKLGKALGLGAAALQIYEDWKQE